MTDKLEEMRDIDEVVEENIKKIVPFDFKASALHECARDCDALYDFYEILVDSMTARERNPDAEIDYHEIDMRAREAARVVSSVLVGITEALKDMPDDEEFNPLGGDDERDD